MKFQIKAQIVLKDKNGKVTKTINKTCNSYVLGIVDLLQFLCNQAAYNSTFTVNDTAGVAKPFMFYYNTNYWGFRGNAPSANDTYGIQVGTGNDAVLISDYKLKTLIAHGDTSTKLNYGATSIGACATVGTTRNFTIARTMTNNSGGDITVNEVGLVLMAFNSAAWDFFMVEHSLLTFTIANGASGTVTYTISATV